MATSKTSAGSRETRPQDIQRHFAEAMNSGKIEAVVALYEPEATLVVPPAGPPVTGHAAIREALESVLALKGKMVLDTTYCIQSGDVALLRGKWHLTGKGPDGEPIIMEGESAEVARRQPDGRWLYIVDHPRGADGS
jgi:ketosteroid isomerase-like protein